MHDFRPFAQAVEAQFRRMAEHELYEVPAEGIFDEYLAAYPEGSNPVFRERTEHDCSCCKHFVRNIGNVVAIIDGGMVSVWDVDGLDAPYDQVAAHMSRLIHSHEISDFFRTPQHQFGAQSSREMRDGKLHVWEHFWADVPDRFVTDEHAAEKSALRSLREVFERGLEEIKPTAVSEIRYLINENQLYRGIEHLPMVEQFQRAQEAYRLTMPEAKKLFTWGNASNMAARFRNTVIGTLAQDLSEGVPLEQAVKSFESKVAPEAYKRPTALITPRMIDAAVSKLRELGLESAVKRRHARLEDVSVRDVLWASAPAQTHMRDGLTDLLMDEVKAPQVDVKGATDIGIIEFMANVLPATTALQVLVSNAHAGNFASITAPVDPDAGYLFRWDNNFAWSYEGDAADTIKKRVKAAGGNVDADLRISLSWSNTDDLDIHCFAPGYRMEISFMAKQKVLDVDMNVHGETREPVENLAFMRPKDGTYEVIVNNYKRREAIDTGFTLEVESAGRLWVFRSDSSPRNMRSFQCLTVKVRDGVVDQIFPGPEMEAGSASREIWGVPTESLVPVTTVMLSPNFWGENQIGNRHWFFMLEGCKNPAPTRGIYNEFLHPALEDHRKVFEVLGDKTKCPVADEQLSGLGFSSTRGDTVTVVASKGSQSRAYNVKI